MKVKSVVVLCLALLAAFGKCAWAQLPPEARRGLWKAQWITSPTAPQRDSVVLRFRKGFNVSQVPEHFIVRVSADPQFVLYVNECQVGRGPARSDLAHWRYETYDLAPLLRTGHNEIASVVWNSGSTPIGQISDRTAFVVQGNTAAEASVDTDDTWQVTQEKGVEFLPTPESVAEFYYVAEPAERIDGALFDGIGNGTTTSRHTWEKPLSIGHASDRGAVLQNTNWQLVADPLPAMEMRLSSVGRVVRASGIPTPVEFPEKPLAVPAHSKVTLLLDHSHLTTAYPELTVSGGAKSTIRLTYAEALVDSKGEKGNRNEIAGKQIVGIFDEFLPDGSSGRRFVPLVWRAWRYLQMDIATADQPLELQDLRSWFTAYPFEERGRFTSDDASLNQIWQVGWRTARLDAHDTYMDTPYYERMQYVGDTRIQALVSYTVAGDDRLARQAIQAFNDSRVPAGITQSRYPSSVTQMIPTFSLLWVGMVHDFWMYRGDDEFVKAQVDGTRTVLDWFLDRQKPDGLMANITWWPFVDWGEDFAFGMPPQDADGGSSVITLQFIEALNNGAELESAFGDPRRAQRYREASAKAGDAVRRMCWNETHGLLADTPAQKHYSQHANILGVWLNVVSQGQQKDVLNRILSASDPGFQAPGPVPPMTKATYYFRFYMARAVEHAGMGDQYLDLLQPWQNMLALGLTTWAEQPEPTRSDSHAWSAHPNYDFLTLVAGIRPKAPGFASVVIEPHPGRLREVMSEMPTPKGVIEVKLTSQATGVDAEIKLPPSMPGELVWKGKTFILHSGAQRLHLP